MNNITQSEIEQLPDQELRARFFELFNVLARSQQVIQECAEMQTALHRIQMELYKRSQK